MSTTPLVILVIVICGVVFSIFTSLTGGQSSDAKIISIETKKFDVMGARWLIYSNGYQNGYIFQLSKGSRKITLEEFQQWALHAKHGGVWSLEIYGDNKSLEDVIDLMPTLKLEPLASEPSQKSIRDYAPIRRYSDDHPPQLAGTEILRPYSVRNHAVYPPFTENIWHVVNSSKNNQCMATFDTEEKALRHARRLNFLDLPSQKSFDAMNEQSKESELGDKIIIVIFFALIALSGLVRLVSANNHPPKSNFVRQLTPPANGQIDHFKERFSANTKSQATERGGFSDGQQ